MVVKYAFEENLGITLEVTFKKLKNKWKSANRGLIWEFGSRKKENPLKANNNNVNWEL